MKILARFRGEEAEAEVWGREEFIDLDFNGSFLIQIDAKTLEPTGNAIDGGGYPLTFEEEELVVMEEEQ